MPTINQSALLPYSQQALFELVDDIEQYPSFMPGCTAAEVLERSDESVRARLTLGRAGMSVVFSTVNTRIPYERMELALLDGPFRHFGGAWTFTALGDVGCRVALKLHFEMSGGMLARPMEMLVSGAAGQLVDAFSRRARAVLEPQG